jgi:hypothetical protein
VAQKDGLFRVVNQIVETNGFGNCSGNRQRDSLLASIRLWQLAPAPLHLRFAAGEARKTGARAGASDEKGSRVVNSSWTAYANLLGLS